MTWIINARITRVCNPVSNFGNSKIEENSPIPLFIELSLNYTFYNGNKRGNILELLHLLFRHYPNLTNNFFEYVDQMLKNHLQYYPRTLLILKKLLYLLQGRPKMCVNEFRQYVWYFLFVLD